MTKNEAIEFMEKLIKLPLAQQLKLSRKIMISDDRFIFREIRQWWLWSWEWKSIITSSIENNNEFLKMLDDENTSDEEIEAYLVMKKLIE